MSLVALTRDASLFAVLRSVLPAEHELVIVDAETALGDQLLAARAAVAILDAGAASSGVERLAARLKAQFPDLVLIVAGDVTAQSAVAAQVSSGLVHRFLHKPVSAPRVRAFVESALRRHDEARPASETAAREAPQPALPPARLEPLRANPFPRTPLLAGGTLALIAVAAIWFATRDEPPQAVLRMGPASSASTTAAPAPAPAPGASVEAPSVPPPAAGAAAVEGRPLTAPPVDEAQLEALLNDAERAILDDDFARAERLVAEARDLAPDNVRAAFLSAQIARQREREQIAREARRNLAQQQLERRLGELLRLAEDRLASGALVDPAQDNANFYVSAAAAIAPERPEVIAARERVHAQLLERAREAVRTWAFDSADRWIAAADEAGAGRTELAALRREIENARIAMEQREQQAQLARQAQARDALVRARAALARSDADGAEATLADAQRAGAPDVEIGALRREIEAARARAREEAAVVPASSLEQTRSVAPKYPSAARAAGTEGWVDVEFVVAIDGTVRAARVLDAEPGALFEEAALAAVTRWRFKPVEREGAPVEQRARIRVRFTLE